MQQPAVHNLKINIALTIITSAIAATVAVLTALAIITPRLQADSGHGSAALPTVNRSSNLSAVDPCEAPAGTQTSGAQQAVVPSWEKSFSGSSGGAVLASLTSVSKSQATNNNYTVVSNTNETVTENTTTNTSSTNVHTNVSDVVDVNDTVDIGDVNTNVLSGNEVLNNNAILSNNNTEVLNDSLNQNNILNESLDDNLVDTVVDTSVLGILY